MSEVCGERRVLDRLRCHGDGGDLSVIEAVLEDGFGEESLMVIRWHGVGRALFHKVVPIVHFFYFFFL